MNSIRRGEKLSNAASRNSPIGARCRVKANGAARKAYERDKRATETDCVAGVRGRELRNVGANYPFEKSHRFPGI